MAKKKSSSFLKVLFDIVALVLGGLGFVLLAMPHLNYVIANNVISNSTGYQLINFDAGYDTGVAIVLLLLAILAGLVMLFAIMKLLCDMSVIKNASFKKFATFGFIAVALLCIVMAIVSLIVVASYASKNYNATLKTGVVACWLMLILEVVASLGTFAFAILSWKK